MDDYKTRSFCGIITTDNKWDKDATFKVSNVGNELEYINLVFNNNIHITVNQQFFTDNIVASEKLRNILEVVRQDIENTSKEVPAER